MAQTKARQEIDYNEFTDEKSESLGKVLTVKELCDLYWNSVNFKVDGKHICCWKTEDGKYYWNGKGAEASEEVLNLKLKTSKHEDYDTDDCLIVWGEVVKEQVKTR